MRRRLSSGLLLSLALGAVACGQDTQQEASSYDWGLPAGLPAPMVPANNPMSAQKVELGRHLFYDKRLSGNQTTSCGTCHEQARAFTDGRAQAKGSTGDLHPRSSMSLTNVAYVPALNWANPLIDTLEEQALIPMFGTDPVELGLADRDGEMLERLRQDARYRELFSAAFPGDEDPFTLQRVVQALASFQRSLLSFGAPYDRYVHGEQDALTPQQKRGMEIFFSEQAECFHCHGGFNFSDTVDHQALVFQETAFHNNGLPEQSLGLFEVTLQPGDEGRFRAPSLRNIAVTAPYMHNGSLETLEEVVEHYAQGGAGVPGQSSFVQGFVLSQEDKAALVAFLESLTDETFLTDPRHADPWAQ